jgi:hypothetical protein
MSNHLDEVVREAGGVRRNDVSSHLDSRVMETMLAEIVQTAIPDRAGRRSHRRAWGLAGGAALALGSTVAVAAVGMSPEQRETGIFNCVIGDLPGGAQGGGIIGSVTGDPVTDCQADYERVSGNPAPPMIAYSNSRGGLEVLPAGVTPPAGYQPLPAGAKQDVELIELNEALGDTISGLNADCFTEAEAVTRSQALVQRLGFTSWTVTVDRTRTMPAAHCWSAGAHGPDHPVRVMKLGVADSKENASLLAMAQQLRPSLTECWDRGTAVARVATAASAAGIPQDHVQVTQVDVSSAPCTVIHLSAGGAIFAILRGPAPG